MALKINKTCRKCSLLLLFMLIFHNGFAQDFSPLDNWLNDNIKSLGGRAVLVLLKDDKIVYENSVTELNGKQKIVNKLVARKKGQPVKLANDDFDMNTKMPIASCSKWLTAALTMTFVDEGKLDINDSIGTYLPIMTLHGKGHITVWQCLSHLTGIESGELKEGIQEITKCTTMEESIEKIASHPMEGTPGNTFRYSNVGLQIIAAIIEKISGKSFEEAFQERIAIPCEMVNTDFGKAKVPLAAGGARSTPKDYINFLNMLLHDGVYNNKQVLSQSAIAAMQENRINSSTVIKYSPAEITNWGYGFGEWVFDFNGKTISSPGLFGSYPWIDNNRKYAGFLFTVNLKHKDRHKKFVALKQLADSVLFNAAEN